MTINPNQIRAARALLKWSQNDLAIRSGVSLPTIANIEVEKQQASTTTQDKLAAAFDEAGIELIEGGVRKRQDIIRVLEGDDAIRLLQEDIYQTLKKSGGDVLFLGLVETPQEHDSEGYAYTKNHIQRLIDIGASEKLLVQEGSTNFIAPKEWYRYIPKEHFTPYTYIIYGDCIALRIKEPYRRAMLIKNKYFAESLRKVFMMIWENAAQPK